MKHTILLTLMFAFCLSSSSVYSGDKQKKAIKALEDLYVSVEMVKTEPAGKDQLSQRIELITIPSYAIEDPEKLPKIIFQLAFLEKTKEIDLYFSELEPQSFQLLGKSSDIINEFKSTQINTIKKLSVSDAEIIHLAPIKNLTHFYYRFFEKSQITEKGIESLSKHSNLIFLGMLNLNLPDAELTSLKNLNKLQMIQFLGCNSITGEIFSELSKEAMTTIYVAGDIVNDDIFEYLKDCKNLERLIIEGPVTGQKLHFLKDLHKLEILSLPNSNVKGKPLASIQKIKSLKILHLHNCPISDSDIPYLKNLGHLELITLGNGNISKNGIKRLKSLLANTEVTHDNFDE